MNAAKLPKEYTLRISSREDDLLPIAQITSETYAGGEYVDEIAEQYFDQCHYDWETSVVGYAGDRLVHHWGVWGYSMRIESVALKTAGIGAVVTREEVRNQGLMHNAALTSFAEMLENDYELSVLRGRHYTKYGYARAWNYVTYRLTGDEIPVGEQPPTYEMLKPEHLFEIGELYNKTYAGFTGTCVRPTFRMYGADEMGAYGWFDAERRISGYVRVVPDENKTTLQCFEACGDVETCLNVLGDLFHKGNYETLSFFTIPYMHPILQLLRKRSCVVEDRYFLNTGWRIKVIHLRRTIEKLLPLLENRLARSQFQTFSGDLQVAGAGQWVTLHIEDGKPRVGAAANPAHQIQAGDAIGRFIIGSDDPQEIIRQEGVQFSGLGQDLAIALFPNLHPVMSQWDEY